MVLKISSVVKVTIKLNKIFLIYKNVHVPKNHSLTNRVTPSSQPLAKVMTDTWDMFHIVEFCSHLVMPTFPI
jgi:hypothetical protein